MGTDTFFKSFDFDIVIVSFLEVLCYLDSSIIRCIILPPFYTLNRNVEVIIDNVFI